MKVKRGQVIDQMADFERISGKRPYTMSRYIVLSLENDEVKLYTLKGYVAPVEPDPHIIADLSKPGDIEIIRSQYIISKEETNDSFYWEVVNDI